MCNSSYSVSISAGPIADALNLNAGYALAACQVAKDAVEGVVMAQEAQRAGKPAEVLSKWVEVSQQLQAAEGKTTAAATAASSA